VGVLVGRHAGLAQLFGLAMIPLAIGTAASIAVTLIYNAHYHRKPSAPMGLPVTAGEPQA
jgi:hypothetical protein